MDAGEDWLVLHPRGNRLHHDVFDSDDQQHDDHPDSHDEHLDDEHEDGHPDHDDDVHIVNHHIVVPVQLSRGVRQLARGLVRAEEVLVLLPRAEGLHHDVHHFHQDDLDVD